MRSSDVTPNRAAEGGAFPHAEGDGFDLAGAERAVRHEYDPHAKRCVFAPFDACDIVYYRFRPVIIMSAGVFLRHEYDPHAKRCVFARADARDLVLSSYIIIYSVINDYG